MLDPDTIKVRIEFVGDKKSHTYRLGLGPCGRVVKHLYVTYSEDSVTVAQTVEGSPNPAYFTYPLRHTLRVAVYRYDPDVCEVKFD